ncbi:MAG: hypothetical protein EHM59_21195 [Betaproteobacteria bacterium]|nr:MAG: hypothetical protein EHM59_21195 [Betaproteobacteria bacterium]
MTPARTVLAVCAASILALVPLAHAANAPGKISGGARYTLPQWFKPSYKRYPSISAYNAARRAELLKSGVDIDYAE